MEARCLACDLAEDSGRWRVEHCVGPLGVGTLVVKPSRHVVHVAELDEHETAELGPLLRLTADVASRLTQAEQVYICLWSHAGGVPVHVHFVVQPVTRETKEGWDAYGPTLQVRMFESGELPATSEVETFAARARPLFANR